MGTLLEDSRYGLRMLAKNLGAVARGRCQVLLGSINTRRLKLDR